MLSYIIADVFSQSTPPSVTCTFSTTSGLKSVPLRIFLQTGLVESSLLSSDCFRLLVPEFDRNINSSAIPSQILNYDSGRTPGCLSTTAISSLFFLLSLSPDASLLDFLLSKGTPNPDNEVLKPWLDFLCHIIVFSPSALLRQTAASRLNVFVAYGCTAALSLQSSNPLTNLEGNTAVAGFVINFLFNILRVCFSTNCFK